MGKKDFEIFLEHQERQKKEDSKIDWEAEKSEWLKYINEFYDMVNIFIKSYTDAGKITIRKEKIMIIEENIGEYETDKLILRMGSHEVVFTPIGTLLIGAKGRIDMSSSAGTARFVLVDKKSSGPGINSRISVDSESEKEKQKEEKAIKWEWKLTTPPPQIKYIDIDEESFFSALMEVVNG